MTQRRVYDFFDSVEAAHVVLYVWLLAGKIWVAGWGSIPLPETESIPVKAGWLFIGFASPVMIFLAYWGIYRGPGRTRYRAFWLRLGADISQFSIMVIFTANLLSHAYGDPGGDHDHHIFTAFFMGALLTFLSAMILRDVLTLAATERIAGKIQRERVDE